MTDRPIDGNTVFTVPEHVLSRKAAGETVLLNLDSEEYHGLDHVGNRVWELIEQQSSFATTVSTIAGEFDVSTQAVEEDLRRLLGDLLTANLIAAVAEP